MGTCNPPKNSEEVLPGPTLCSAIPVKSEWNLGPGNSGKGSRCSSDFCCTQVTLFPRVCGRVKPYLTKQLGNPPLSTVQLFQGPDDHEAGNKAAASACLLRGIWPSIKLSSQAIFRTRPRWHGYHRPGWQSQGPGTLCLVPQMESQ